MFDYVTFPKYIESDGNDGPITLEALALAAFNAAVEANSSDSTYEAGKLERRFVEFLDVYARTYIAVHGYAKPSTDLKIEDFNRDDDPIAGWDEIPSDAGDERFNLPDSGSKGPRLSAAQVRKLAQAEKLACAAVRAAEDEDDEDEDDEDEGFRW